MLFDLLEVGAQRCCTCGYLSEGLASQGVITGPFIHGRTSVHFELTCDKVLEWLAWLIRNGSANVLVLVVGGQDPLRSSVAAASHGPHGAELEAPAVVLAALRSPLRMLTHSPRRGFSSSRDLRESAGGRRCCSSPESSRLRALTP